MKNELLDTIDHAIDKDRVYKHTTKKNLETKNRKKTVDRKTYYESKPQDSGYPLALYISHLAESIKQTHALITSDESISDRTRSLLNACDNFLDKQLEVINNAMS